MALAVIGTPANNTPNYGLTPNMSVDGQYVYSVELGEMVTLPAYYEVSSFNSTLGQPVPLWCGRVNSPGVVVNTKIESMMTVVVTDANGVVYNGTFIPTPQPA